MPYMLFLALHDTVIIVDLPIDEIKFKPNRLVGKGGNFKDYAICSIQAKDMLEVAYKTSVRPVIEKVPMSKVSEGIPMVRSCAVHYCVVPKN
ncbi:hypothetical protein DVH05_014023 [Phytophthora capsici]|nr:hypothetical protein DVH05_014023 [Phytophthora capsici]|eukprot:jgi/Phyca11/126393/e_gw1.62.140.1